MNQFRAHKYPTHRCVSVQSIFFKTKTIYTHRKYGICYLLYRRKRGVRVICFFGFVKTFKRNAASTLRVLSRL